MSVPTPITPATAPSASRTGEYHASNTAPNTSTGDENVSPVRARRTSAIACGKSANSVNAECPRRSEEHTSELQSRLHLVCRLLLEKKKTGAPFIVASGISHRSIDAEDRGDDLSLSRDYPIISQSDAITLRYAIRLRPFVIFFF